MYIIIYDFGTSKLKTCLFEISSQIRLEASSIAGYGLYISNDGGAEQDTKEWWDALCTSTQELFKQTDVKPREIEGMAFCTQIQGSVFVDENGNALRRPMNYLDQKGYKEFMDCMGSGLIKVSGCSLYKLMRNLIVNYAGSTSAKDPVWKYKWVEKNEPEVFGKIYKWLDVSDYLTSRNRTLLGAGGARLSPTAAKRRPNLVRVRQDSFIKKQEANASCLFINYVHERIRTSDLPLRRRSLYPAELRRHLKYYILLFSYSQILIIRLSTKCFCRTAHLI